MSKRIICVLLSVVCILCFSSCEDDSEVLINKTRYVAVVSDSDETMAAKVYCDSIGGELSEYASSFDAVTAVRNGKADFVVLNEYEAQSFIDSKCELEFSEKCEYKLEYRAIFNFENKKLLNEFNEAIESLTNDGTFDKIKQSHIKGESFNVPDSSGEKGELVMLCDPIFENRVYYNDENVLMGTDVDIAKTICAYLGYDLVIEVADFDTMFFEIESGNADFIMSSAEYTEQRAENFLFSDVYSALEYNVYTRKE